MVNHKNIEVIGDGVVEIGSRTTIQPGVQVIFHAPGKVIIGDYCTIGAGVKIICDGGNVTIGDWTSLHDRCLLLSTEGLIIGEHGWFGQHTVLDGTGGLHIGNGVRVGMYSQIWSHVAAGEQIEGCTLYGTRPVKLEDDVWLVGSCIVASGVTLGRRTVALIASNITKSWPANTVLAGSPANRKEALNFYSPITPEAQWVLLEDWLAELAETLPVSRIDVPSTLAYVWSDGRSDDLVTFVRNDEDAAAVLQTFPDASICVLSTKRYFKRVTELEHRVLKFLSGNKARFMSMSLNATS